MTKTTVLEGQEAMELKSLAEVINDVENNENELESTEGILDKNGDVVMKDFIERKSSIKKAKVPMTVRQMVKEKATIRFDLAEQRNVVWKDEQKSLFIHTLIFGYPFPTAFAISTNDGNIWMLDGKQRTTSILSFINDEWKLHKATPDVFGVEIKGRKFSELPKAFQDEILDTSFDIWEMKNLSNAERAEMFFRLNNGSALTKLEVTRSMYADLFAEVSDLADLPFFADIISLTDSARNRYVDQELVVQIAMLLDEGHKLKGFGGNHIREYVLDLKKEGGNFSEEMEKCYHQMSRYLEEAFDGYSKQNTNKALKKINVPMIFMQGVEAQKLGMKPAQFGEFVKWFLVDIYNIESAYGQSCQSGSAKRENVLVRLKEMDKAFKKYIKKHPIESYVQAPKEVEAPTEGESTETITPDIKEITKLDLDTTRSGYAKDEPTADADKPKPTRKRNTSTSTKATGTKSNKEKEGATV